MFLDMSSGENFFATPHVQRYEKLTNMTMPTCRLHGCSPAFPIFSEHPVGVQVQGGILCKGTCKAQSFQSVRVGFKATSTIHYDALQHNTTQCNNFSFRQLGPYTHIHTRIHKQRKHNSVTSSWNAFTRVISYITYSVTIRWYARTLLARLLSFWSA